MAGIFIKRNRDDDEDGNWRVKGRLLAATAVATEIFAHRREGFSTIDTSHVVHAETVMLQPMNFTIDFGDALKLSGFCLRCTTYLEAGSREVQGFLEHETTDHVCSHGKRY